MKVRKELTDSQLGIIRTLFKIQHRIRQMKTIRKIAAVNTHIMSPETEAIVESALAQFCKRAKWVEWGMDSLRKQGNMVLLFGPPGTGKTKIAEYMSKRVGRSMLTINMKDIGGKAPGQTERTVAEKFEEARQGGNKSIFMDECEAIVWDRGRAGSDSMWMVGVIDELLMQTAKYPGLVIAATNRDDIIDAALKDRCFACLQIGMPGEAERIRLWKQKMPARFPLTLTPVQIESLSDFELTGRQIENAIVHEASQAIVQNRQPNFKSLKSIVEELASK